MIIRGERTVRGRLTHCGRPDLNVNTVTSQLLAEAGYKHEKTYDTTDSAKAVDANLGDHLCAPKRSAGTRQKSECFVSIKLLWFVLVVLYHGTEDWMLDFL
jgi:hypothetical protein